jgi:tetratricopeptide (TPR) repeat protein
VSPAIDDMRNTKVIISAAAALLLLAVGAGVAWYVTRPAGRNAPATAPGPVGDDGFVGTASCRECHEKFYKLWAPSHHGLAMQPFGAEFAGANLTGPAAAVTIGDRTYRVELGGGTGRVREMGPDGEKTYPMAHVLGGKNVYYFLTPMPRGRLQVLPIAYDVRRDKWYDTAASGIRHFVDRPADEAVPWTDPAYTFNTSCHSCHVSQLSTNYDLKKDTYRTAWAEPGINCEVCHGPGAEHVRVCRAAREGTVPTDLKIIITKRFTAAQHNATCAPCHAKMMPLTTSFRPGDRFFDHYDLVTLEDTDFHPDGRDLGENYTHTLWLTSPCVKSGQLHCVHCHTASGRYRFADPATADNACLPCHKEHVADPKPHTQHEAGKGGLCIDCHMPKTGFARMMRTDHSMRPPTPAVTVALKSPNVCNLCHKDKDAKWADGYVRKWRERDYQAPVLRRARLIAAARKGDWRKLDDMLAYIADPKRDEVFATGLIRLLLSCRNERKWPALLKALEDPSPLVRSSAAAGLAGHLTPGALRALLKATEDEYRLVRIRAAGTLADHPRRLLSRPDAARLRRATKELEASLTARLDDWASHYNMGNHLTSRGDAKGALAAYRTASKLRPDAVPPLVNASMLHAGLGQMAEAERLLAVALRVAPTSAAVNFNLGLLFAGKGETVKAKHHLRAALKADPNSAEAAYNLGVLLSADRMPEALRWCRKAAELRPASGKYAYTLAFYLHRSGDANGAVKVLAGMIGAGTAGTEAYGLLAAIYEEQGKLDDAKATYRRALSNPRLPARDRQQLRARLQALERR